MSPRHLTIAVTFPAARYHGGEWPPSPARLYQALVAGLMTCGYRRHADAVESALRWLETLDPPQIRACDAADLCAYRIAVPNNDMDVVAREWAKGRQADPAALRTMKEIRPRSLPEDGPHVQYVWQVNEGQVSDMIERLRTGVHCLHTLGWGVDMAFADVAEARDSSECYEPAPAGNGWEVPMKGTLDDLNATYERFTRRAAAGAGVDTHTRPSLFRLQGYRRVGDVQCAATKFMLMSPDGDQVKAVAWENCMKVAGWLRHAAAERLKSECDAGFIESYVQGHTKDDDKSNRVSYVPVPSIYGRYNDGLIRRVMIVEPQDAAVEVGGILRLKLMGRLLTDSQGVAVCGLGPAQEGDWTFGRYAGARAEAWRTVTPVVLHGYNTDRRGSISVAKTERLLLRAFEMAGYEEKTIAGLAFQAAPWWPGTKHAAAIKVPAHLNGFPRLHVEVRFRAAMTGPILAGIGRHYGIGLFASAGS